MERKKLVIETSKAPGAIGPYSQAVAAGGFLYVSGQLGIDPETKQMAGSDAASQAVQAMNNLKAIVEEAGASMEDVLKTTILLTDLGAFSDVNREYSAFFTDTYPARACYEVSALPAGGLVEIEAVVLLHEKESV